MSKAKHTPGPWKVTAGYVANDTEVIVNYWKPAETMFTVTERDVAESRANANLIAAAPDLLDACLIALHQIEQFGGEYPAIEKISNAIAKAGG
jgi:hypothetical protein